MAETLSTLSIISFVIAGVSLVVAVFLWFLFKIPTVIGDLSGRTARKSIAKMRASNEKTGNKNYRESKTNVSRGKLTGTMPNSGKISEKKEENKQLVETGVLAENRAQVVNTDETATLDTEATGLLVDEDATAPLDTHIQSSVKREGGKKLVILEEVMLVHTDEVIE